MTLHLLVVDDDPLMRQMLPPLLEGHIKGHDVVIETVGTREEALTRIQDVPLDRRLVVLSDFDLKAPKNGLTLLAEAVGIRDDAILVLFSGHAREEIHGIEGAKIHGFLEKPFRLQEMVTHFREIVERALEGTQVNVTQAPHVPASAKRADAARSLEDKEMVAALVRAASKGETQRAGTLAMEARRRGHVDAERSAIDALTWQTRALEKIATGAPLPETLTLIASAIEDRCDDLRVAIHLTDASGARLLLGAAPSLPPEYHDAFDGLMVDPPTTVCASAAYHRGPMIVVDAKNDPLWARHRTIATAHAIASSWSTPIVSAGGRVLGTFSFYHADARTPTQAESQHAELAVNLARAAIESDRDRQALRRAEAQWRAISDCSPLGVFKADAAGLCTYVNRRLCEMMDAGPQDFLGTGWRDMVHPDDRDEAFHAWARASAKGLEFDEVFRWRTKSGRVVWTRSRASPARESERLVGYVGAVEDITHQRAAEEELRASHERYRALYDNIPNMYFTVGEDGTVYDVNLFGARALGYEPADLIGKPVFDVFLEDDRDAVRQAVQAFKDSGERSVYWEFRKVRKDGRVIWVGESIQASKDEFGRPVLLVACHDITDRKAADERIEKAKEAARERWHSLFLQAPAAIAMVEGPRHTYSFANQRYLELVGRTEHDLIGNAVIDVFPEVVGQGYTALLDGVLRTGEPFHGEGLPLTLQGPEGSKTVFLNFVYQPVRNSEGQVTGVMVHAVDVTTQIEAQKRTAELAVKLDERVKERTSALMSVNRDLAQANDMLESFSYVISHDLKEPVRAIEHYLDLATMRVPPGDALQFIERARDANRSQQGLIQGLLAYSRASFAPSDFGSIDLGALLTGPTQAYYQQAAAERNATVDIDPIPNVRGDAVILSQIFGNLILNAIRHNLDAAPKVHVHAASREGGKVDIFVDDNGPGIPKHVQQRMHAASRAPPTTTKGGFGLIITQRSINRLGGELHIEDSPQGGARIRVTLPAATEK